jgi:flavorubredoxin
MLNYGEFEKGSYYINGNHQLNPEMILPINRFLINGSKKKMLIDTGMMIEAKEMVKTVAEIINLEELDYIFLTHFDVDHWGAVPELLKYAPNVRIIGTMATMGKGESVGLPQDKFAVVFPGETIDLGDHQLTVENSLVEDGHTYWLFDNATNVYYTSDGFGSIQLGQPELFAESVDTDKFVQGFMMWHMLNFNSFPRYDYQRFVSLVDLQRKRDIKQIASVHGPIVRTDLQQAFDLISAVPVAEQPPLPELPPFLRL